MKDLLKVGFRHHFLKEGTIFLILSPHRGGIGLRDIVSSSLLSPYIDNLGVLSLNKNRPF